VVPDNHGWALTENGNVKRGRAMTERGFAMREANANAVHALLHAMFEDGSVAGRRCAGDALDSNLPAQRHSAWPYPLAPALGALEHGDAARALSIYARCCSPLSPRAALNAVTDGRSLLWRLQAYGHAVPGTLWSEAGRLCAARLSALEHSLWPTCIWRCSRRPPATRPHSASGLAVIEKRLAEGKLPAGPVVPGLFRAMSAFADGDYCGCVTQLEPVLARWCASAAATLSAN